MSRRRPPHDPLPVRVGAFELSRKGIARFDLSDPYHLAVTLTWPQFFLTLLLIYLTINIGFAALYAARPGCVANAAPGSLSDAFFFSIETLATVGYGVMAPVTPYGHVVSTIEIMVGMVFTAIMTGLLFVRFSKPRAKILYADKAVVSRRNGHPTLMLRIGNGRKGVLTEAAARLSVLIHERTAEGAGLRRLVDLTLVRSQFPLFALTWTLMHEIDDTSPLRGLTPGDMITQGIRLFLTLEARDHALGTPVYDLKDYSARDIAFGMRYVDAVSIDSQGRTLADLTRLSAIEAESVDSGAQGGRVEAAGAMAGNSDAESGRS